MALNLNKVILAGRLATAPEVKQTSTGKAVCNFRLAVNRPFSKGDHPESDFFIIQAWGATAEFVGKHFGKGGAICICGKIQNRSWTDKNGEKQYVTEIIADEVNFVERREYKDPVTMPYEVAGQPYTTPTTPTAPQPVEFKPIGNDDDLPF